MTSQHLIGAAGARAREDRSLRRRVRGAPPPKEGGSRAPAAREGRGPRLCCLRDGARVTFSVPPVRLEARCLDVSTPESSEHRQHAVSRPVRGSLGSTPWAHGTLHRSASLTAAGSHPEAWFLSCKCFTSVVGAVVAFF